MKALIAFVLRVVELLEAEGRALKQAFWCVLVAMVVALLAANLAVIGSIALAASLYAALAEVMHPALALLLDGAALLLLAFICSLIARAMIQRSKSNVT